MIINNEQLSDRQLDSLDALVELARQHDGGSPAIYKHLLILKRDTPNNFLYYTPASTSKRPELIGFLSLYFFYEHAAEVSLLVHPDYRHQDIAKMLLDAAFPLCRIKKVQKLIFSTPPNEAPPLLKVMGASLHHREYHFIRTQPEPEPLHTSKLLVRHAKQSDLSGLCVLDKECFHTENSEEMKDRFLTLLSDESYSLLVAELDGVLMGKVHLRSDEDEVFLSDLAILPAFQHQGLGRELLVHAILHVHEQNIQVMTLEVETSNEAALALYTSCGFEVIDTIDFYMVSPLPDETRW